MNSTNGVNDAMDFDGHQEDATIKGLVGEDGSLEDVIEQVETGLLDGFLDYFLDDGAAPENPLSHLLDDICTEKVVEKKNKENVNPSGNEKNGQPYKKTQGLQGQEDATIKEFVGMNGDIEDVIEQAEIGLLDGFLDYFLDDGARPEDSLCHLMDEICKEDVLEEENKENENASGKEMYGQPSDNALSFGIYQDQRAVSSFGPIRKTEKKRTSSKPYEIATLVHAATNPDVAVQDVTHVLDFPVADAIDTKKTVKDVKNWMKLNGVNQTTFAEKVLQKTQGHFSFISRNPAPWEELLAPGKAVFVRMYNFMKLSDEEKTKILSVKQVSVVNKDLQVEKKKKARFTYSKEQMETLMGIYKVNDRPGKELIKQLAKKFSLSDNQIKDFFLNRRRRANKSNL